MLRIPIGFLSPTFMRLTLERLNSIDNLSGLDSWVSAASFEQNFGLVKGDWTVKISDSVGNACIWLSSIECAFIFLLCHRVLFSSNLLLNPFFFPSTLSLSGALRRFYSSSMDLLGKKKILGLSIFLFCPLDGLWSASGCISIEDYKFSRESCSFN